MRHDTIIAALRELAMPVVIVAATDGEDLRAATATTMYATLDPPSVLVSLGRTSRTAAAVRASGRVSLSLLGQSQVDVAVRLGRRGPGDPFADNDIPATSRDGYPPAVAGATVLWGRVTDELAAGDHDVFLVTVELVEVGAGADLVRRHRAYHGVGQALGDPEQGYPL